MIAHVDVNNFFASCERVFRPDLDKTPVAILSNNDGCIIARSKEVKDMGVKMADPVFRWKSILDQRGTAIFSANFSLYGDMSRRVNEVLSQFAPKIEIYSVDEAFLDLSKVAQKDHKATGQKIVKTVLDTTRLPVSVGLGPNKTLAKLATNWAKKSPDQNGVSLAIPGQVQFKAIVDGTAAGDIWGIGRQFNKKLRSRGVLSASDFIALEPKLVKDLLGATGARTHRELRGQKSMAFDSNPGLQKSMLVSRSFGRRCSKLSEMEPAIVNFCGRLGWQLRQNNLLAREVGVFIEGDDRMHQKAFNASGKIKMVSDTNSTSDLINSLTDQLVKVFRPGISYRRAGIWASEIVEVGSGQVSLMDSPDRLNQSQRLDQAVDTINQKYGKGSVRRAIESESKSWKSSRQDVSPKYTISWADIPVVR